VPTKTIKSAGGDYTTVALWEADTDNDLAGTGENIGEIYDVNTTAAITIAGATNTDATNFRHLTTAAANRHAGVWDTGKSNFQVSATNVFVTVSEAFGKISYLQAKNTHATLGGGVYRLDANSTKIEQCIGWQTAPATGDTAAGIYLNSGGTGQTVRNCVLYSNRNGIFANHTSASSITIENTDCVGNTLIGIRSSLNAALTIKNVYCGGNTGDDFNEGGTAGWSSWTATTCMCEDALTETGLTGSIAWSTANFTNVTAGSIDIHLVTGSALIDVGTDLSGSFTADIDGVARSGTWDVGADEFVAAGGGGRFVNNQIILGVG
jgi:hypothetical protein